MPTDFQSFYKTLSDLLADIHDNGDDLNDTILSMQNYLEISDISPNNANKVQLLGKINQVKNDINKRHETPTQTLLNVVLSFQLLVGQTSEEVNEYLQAEGIKVKCSFAYLSSLVGYIIDIENIEDVEYCDIFFEVGE